MACDRCGNIACSTYYSCTICNPDNQKKVQFADPAAHEAGRQLGSGLVEGLIWLAGNKYLSFLWFWLAWIITAMTLGDSYVFRPTDDNYPGWFIVLSVFVPIGLAVIFRKAIMKYVPMLLLTIVHTGFLIVLGIIVLFLIMFIYHAFS